VTDTDRARQLRNLINRRVATTPEQFLPMLERITRTLEVKRNGGGPSEDSIAAALLAIEATIAAEDAEESARIAAGRAVPA
jgi:hypothetical protein